MYIKAYTHYTHCFQVVKCLDTLCIPRYTRAEEKIKEIDRRAAALKDTIAQSAKVQAARQTFAASLEQAREILQDLPEWMLSDDPKIVNGLLSRLILHMTIHPDGSVKVTLRG